MLRVGRKLNCFDVTRIRNTQYNANTPATLDAILGHWDLVDTRGVTLAIDINANGVVTGTYGSCTLKASAIKPSISGKNVFALVLATTQTPSGCDGWLNGAAMGFALAFPSAGGGTQLVIGAEFANAFDPAWFLAAAGKR